MFPLQKLQEADKFTCCNMVGGGVDSTATFALSHSRNSCRLFVDAARAKEGAGDVKLAACRPQQANVCRDGS